MSSGRVRLEPRQVENGFFRYKTIIGDKLRSRKFANQAIEIFTACTVLNKKAELGMPESYPVR
jgi:hypothetical protein